MRILLDTHAFLWFHLADPKLTATARQAIESDQNEPLVSIASLWEIAIKASLGKLTLKVSFQDFVDAAIASSDATTLPLTVTHLAVLESLPFHHRDPFDRTLVAQATSEGVPVVTGDAEFDAYGVTTIW